jgi:AraC family transcriptional regulator
MPHSACYVACLDSLVQKNHWFRKKGSQARQRQGETTGGLFDSETRTGRAMDPSISLHQNPHASAIGAPPPEPLRRPLPAVEFFPAGIVRHRTAHWRGVQAKTVQIINHEHFEYSFKQQCHLLVAVEQGVRYDGETFVEGLPTSTLRNYSHKLIFVPAARRFFGAQKPRLLTRSICLYIDPRTVLVDPDLRFAEADLQPRLLFEDSGIWGTVLKLKALIGSADPSDRMYGDALGGLLSHELLRLNGATPASRRADRGGLAAWQQRRVMDFMEEHLAEDISLHVLADLVRLSPYHFLRSFKQSFGEPPHRYWTARRIKALLANPRASVTEIAFDVGFSAASAFSAAFHRITGQTPRNYRRSLE